MTDTTNTTRDPEAVRLAAFAQHRRYLFAVAYRLLGVAEDAEDILQDAWLRFASSPPIDELDSPRAYLVTIVTRLALDQFRSARHRREQYVGPWLPEPIPSSEALPEDLVEQRESASFAFLLLLERLNPTERVAVVLHEVFDYGHPEIAAITGQTPAASRQTLRRARLKLGDARPSTAPPAPVEQAHEFVAAMQAGDITRLVNLLAPDVVLISDGGGIVSAANRPLVGSQQLARFFITMARMPEAAAMDVSARIETLNGQTALLLFDGPRLDTTFLFDSTPAGLTAIYAVRNPKKLRRLEARFASSEG